MFNPEARKGKYFGKVGFSDPIKNKTDFHIPVIVNFLEQDVQPTGTGQDIWKKGGGCFYGT